MTDIKPELIEKSAQALHDMRSRRSWAFHEIGQPLGDTVYDDERRADARAALEADQLLSLGDIRALCATGEAREIREANRLTVAEVARAAQVDYSAVSRWERGERFPRGEAAHRYAELLRILASAKRRHEAVLETVRAEAKAEALREAADAWGAGEWQEAWLADAVEDDASAVRSTVTWLRAHADRIEAGSGDA